MTDARRPNAGPLERLLRPFAEVRAGEALDALLLMLSVLLLLTAELVVVWLFIVIGIGRRHRALTRDGNAPTPIG